MDAFWAGVGVGLVAGTLVGLSALLLGVHLASAGLTAAVERVSSAVAFPRVGYPMVPTPPQDAEEAYRDTVQDDERVPSWMSWADDVEGVKM